MGTLPITATSYRDSTASVKTTDTYTVRTTYQNWTANASISQATRRAAERRLGRRSVAWASRVTADTL